MTQTEYNKLRKACIKNAERLLKAAQSLTDPADRHISYHLGVLALEEIGKMEMAGVELMSEQKGDEETKINPDYEDHEVKLFWALWGPSFGKELITKKSIGSLKDLRKSIHEKRLSSLYVDAGNPQDVAKSVSKSELNNLLSLTKARLGMEQVRSGVDIENVKLTDKEKTALDWFMSSPQNPQDKALVFGGESNRKLVELNGDVHAWVSWLYEEKQKIDDKAKELVEQELKRQKPNKSEATKPKWRMKIRLASDSHSIRPAPLNTWNSQIERIHLYKGKDNKELILELIMPKSIPVGGVYPAGLNQAKMFTAAINIATRGFIWWNIPRDKNKYYDELEDLEASDPKYRVEVGISPSLDMDWQKHRLKLGDSELNHTAMVFFFIVSLDEPKASIVRDNYMFGLTLLSKNDLHLRIEREIFTKFWEGLTKAIVAFGDSKDGSIEDIKKVIPEELHEAVEKCVSVDAGLDKKTGESKSPITLEEVYFAKILLEYYLFTKAKAWAEAKKKTGKK